ncbi:MAG: S-layer homology domain-containing protein [Lawsonibacter sp.]
MAVVMANLMDYRVASYEGTSPFTDVPSWAEPYVAACYTNGITSGISATQYGGDQPVTTAQAALMLMKALGYFQYQSDFGTDWQYETIKQANLLDLFVDVKSGVRENMTRNDVAQLVLNTLESGTVTADDDTIKVEADGVTVEAGKVKYNYVTSGEKYASAIKSLRTYNADASAGGTGEYIVELGEKLYQGDLKRQETGVTNGFNAPAVKWSYDAVEVGTYAKNADYTFEGKVKSSAMYNAVGKTAVNNYSWNVYLDGNVDLDTLVSSGTFDSDDFLAQVAAKNNADLTGPARGTTTYVYINEDVSPKEVTVCIVSTYAAEVVQSEDGTITLDDNDLEFDVEGYDEEDVVLYTKSQAVNGDWTVESVLGVAERVEGTVTKVKNTDSVVIDDTTYNYNSTVATTDKITVGSYDENVAFYLDQQGNIVRIGEATESNDYAYVISMGKEDDKYGETSEAVFAKMVLADGTILKIEVNSDDYNDTLADARSKFNNKIVSYTEEDDGTYSLSAKSDATISTVGTSFSVKGGSTPINGMPAAYGAKIYGDKNTVYVICDDASEDDYSVYVGYNNVPDITGTDETKAVAYVKDGVAKMVYVTDVTTESSADDVIFVIGDPTTNQIKSSAGNYYEFKAVVKGEATTIMVRQGSKAADYLVADGPDGKSVLGKKDIGVFFGMTESSKGLVTDLKTTLPSKVEINGAADPDADWRVVAGELWTGTKRVSTTSGLVGFGYVSATKDYANWLGADEDAIVAYYDYAGNSITGVGSINTLRTDTNDDAVVVTDDGSIIAVLVLDK